MSFAYLERCFAAQAHDDGPNNMAILRAGAAIVVEHEHEPEMLAALTYGAAPNLLLWTGAGHQLALSLKWDYVPVSIRREPERDLFRADGEARRGDLRRRGVRRTRQEAAARALGIQL